jgi:phage FluMu protein Com
MIHSIRCSHCDAVLKSPNPRPAGKKMKCPKCRQIFTAHHDEPETAMQTAPAAMATSKRSRHDDDTMDYVEDFEDESRPRGKLASPHRGRMPLWLILLIAVVPVVLVLAVVAILLFAATSPQALIIGTWKATEPVPGVVVEFHREGTLIVRQNGLQASARYRLIDDKLVELELPNQDRQLQGMLPRLGRFNQVIPGRFNQAVPETVKVNATILTLTRTELVIRINDVVQRFKRGE